MGSNLEVKITADIAELQSKFAVARAEANQTAAEMNKLARAIAAGTADPTAGAQLQKLARSYLETKQEAAGLSGALEKAGFGFRALSGGAGESGLHVATAAREVRKFSEELSSGNITGAEVSLLRLAAHLTGLGPAGLVAVGAVAGLTLGLGYLIVKAIEASRALDSIYVGAQFAGNMDISRQKAQEFADTLHQTSQFSYADSLKITQAITQIPELATPAMQALVKASGDFAGETGKDAKQISEAYQHIFSPSMSATQFADSIPRLSAPLRQMAVDADATGDENAKAAAKMQLFAAQLQRGGQALSENRSSATDNMAAILALGDSEYSSATAADVQNDALQDQLALRKQLIDELNKQAAATRAQAATGDQTVNVGIKAAEKENPVAKQVKDAQVALAELQRAFDALKAGPATDAAREQMNLLSSAITQAQEKLSSLQLGPAMERMREQMSQLAATNEGTQSQLLSRQIAVARTALTEVSGSAKETLEVKTELDRLEVQLRTSTDAEILASTRRTNTEIQGDTTRTTAQRLEAERALWQQTLTEVHSGSAAYKEAQQEVASFSTQIARHAADEQRTIEQQNVETQIAIGHTRIAAERSVLEEELAAHRVTAAQKLAALSALTQQETDLDIKGLQARLAVAGLEPAERNRINNQILEARAKLNADLAALDRQAAADAKRTAQEQANAWKDAVNEIEGAETGMISSVLSRRKSFGQALYQEAAKVADQEIESFIRAETTRNLLQDKDKALEQGGLLYHLAVRNEEMTADQAAAAARRALDTSGLAQATATDQAQAASYTAAQSQMTGATAAGTATRRGIEQSGGNSFFSLITQTLAKWFGLESSKTGATGAAETQRTTLQAAAAATAATETATAAASQISSDAGVAAAGAAASVASIPVIGWAMAPGVAAETFGMVMAYQGAAALAKGAWEVPEDMPAFIHAGEMVVPAVHAEALRSAVSERSGFGGLSSTITSAGTAHDTASGISEAVGQMAQIGANEAPASEAAARAIGADATAAQVAPAIDLSGIKAPNAESRDIVQAAERMGSGANVGDRVTAFSELVKNVAAFHHYEVGAYDVPEDQLAHIHAGEMVLPAAQADAMRDALGGAASDDTGVKAMLRAAVGGGGSVAAAAAAEPVTQPVPAGVAGVSVQDRETAAGQTTVPGSGGINYQSLEDEDVDIPPDEVPAGGYKKFGVAQGGLVYNIPSSAERFGEKTLFPPVLGGSLGPFGLLMGGPLMELIWPHLFVGFENWFNELFGGTKPGSEPVVPPQPGAVTSAWGTVVGPATSQYGTGPLTAASVAGPVAQPVSRFAHGDIAGIRQPTQGTAGGFNPASFAAVIEAFGISAPAAMQFADEVAAQRGRIAPNVSAYSLPSQIAAAPAARSSGLMPEATALASSGRSTEERGGDTIGDTHMTWHYHQGRGSPEEIMAIAQKAIRNFHPVALAAMRRGS